ncbi:MAG: hypothetical protein ACD_69C00274G0001 [uncultured bacterium]|nr:MAG: hypothetical protein ACD_69C00274G0001 [uncultured bacterium]OGT08792.1 MAG: YggU family protein [Gammaproteobacteria bacterium RBG_16_37_9]HBC71555.1 YggU family protein [Coxiellaceae bacterium]HBY55350.1 YggU family protein [Coxiellaceae bacterium]
MNKKITGAKFYTWNSNNLLLEAQIQTKANKNAFIGEHNNRLKIAITAAPTDGKANEHLIKFLAKYFGVSQNQVKIIKGLRSKLKSIMISSPKKNIDKFRSKLNGR